MVKKKLKSENTDLSRKKEAEMFKKLVEVHIKQF